MADRTLTPVPLDDLEPNPRNPKAHATDVINDSVSRLGYVEPVVIDQRTGYLVSGHGRRTTLMAMRERGDDPPEGITVDDDGNWLVPAVTGWESRSDDEAAAALIALNRTGELGGWVDDELLDLLDTLAQADDGLAGVGFAEVDLGHLRDKLAGLDGGGDGGDGFGVGGEFGEPDLSTNRECPMCHYQWTE